MESKPPLRIPRYLLEDGIVIPFSRPGYEWVMLPDLDILEEREIR